MEPGVREVQAPEPASDTSNPVRKIHLSLLD
jgi:hypothetical protein